MSSKIPSQFVPFQMLLLLVGGWLGLITHSTPAQAQIRNSSLLLAQQRIETLPPPPLEAVPFGQQPLPQLQPGQPIEVNQYEPNLQPRQPVELNQYEQNFQQPSESSQFGQYNRNGRYSVYVESNDPQILRTISQIEPSAYFRTYQGRTVIQSGVFNRASNAQERVRELESRGIYSARIASFADGQEINTLSGGNRGSSLRRESNYYVAIPTKVQDLGAIANEIRRNIGQYEIVLERTQPRGPHIAVGPFLERSQAERWNKELRRLGYGDARVYYGK